MDGAAAGLRDFAKNSARCAPPRRIGRLISPLAAAAAPPARSPGDAVDRGGGGLIAVAAPDPAALSRASPPPRLTARRRPRRRLLKRCEKPDAKEFAKVARLTAVGFLAVGFIGFFVKLIFIPINQVLAKPVEAENRQPTDQSLTDDRRNEHRRSSSATPRPERAAAAAG